MDSPSSPGSHYVCPLSFYSSPLLRKQGLSKDPKHSPSTSRETPLKGTSICLRIPRQHVFLLSTGLFSSFLLFMCMQQPSSVLSSEWKREGQERASLSLLSFVSPFLFCCVFDRHKRQNARSFSFGANIQMPSNPFLLNASGDLRKMNARVVSSISRSRSSPGPEDTS
mmetsp:Transcript_20394/g.52236  ORF Transcript_20394/g.52236 Transcript_20394/m.52236 type:complete len:168 (+) Transcript_20394:302-805(+)